MVIFKSWTIKDNILEATVNVPCVSYDEDFLIRYNKDTDSHWVQPGVPGLVGRTAGKAVYEVLNQYNSGQVKLGQPTGVVWG